MGVGLAALLVDNIDSPPGVMSFLCSFHPEDDLDFVVRRDRGPVEGVGIVWRPVAGPAAEVVRPIENISVLQHDATLPTDWHHAVEDYGLLAGVLNEVRPTNGYEVADASERKTETHFALEPDQRSVAASVRAQQENGRGAGYCRHHGQQDQC